MFQITRRKVLQISRCDLSSNRSFARFQTNFKSKQKRKEIEKKEKVEKAAGQHSGLGQLLTHGPFSFSSEAVPSSPASSH
jgi:hypothetical protein